MRHSRRIRVWLVAVFLLVSAVTAAAVAAWVIPAADQQFAGLERTAALGSAVEAAGRVGRATPTAMATTLAAVSRTDGVSLWLIGSDGRDIARATLPGTDRSRLAGADFAVNEALAGRRFVPPDDATLWIVALPVLLPTGEHAAVLAYETDTGFGTSAGRVLRRQLLYGAAIALVVAGLIGFVIAARVSRRVERIARAAGRIADGDFDEAIPPGFGDEIGALAVSIDVMRRRLAGSFAAITTERERLATLIDQLDEGVIALASDGSIEFANRAATRLLGQEPRSAANVAELLGPAGGEGWLERPELPQTRGVVAVNQRILHVQVAPLAQRGGAAVLVVVSDRTDEHQREEIERRFVTNASHELRTPLAAIVAAVEVLQSGAKDDPPVRDQFLDDLQREAGRLDRLTVALLTLARIGTGELEPHAGTVEVGAVARHAASMMLSLASAGGIALRVDGAATVLADADLIEQVLVGLIGNAIKHTPPGGEITIRVRDGRDAVAIVVEDTGEGIAAEDLPRIFDRFFQADGSRVGGGFGLGLATCREFVTAMGGTVTVDSVVGTGTTIGLRLPRGPVERTTTATPSTAGAAR